MQSCEVCSVPPRQHCHNEQDEAEEHLDPPTCRSFWQTEDSLVVLSIRQIRGQGLGEEERLVSRTNRFLVHCHETGVLADEMVRQGESQHCLLSDGLILPLPMLIHDRFDVPSRPVDREAVTSWLIRKINAGGPNSGPQSPSDRSVEGSDGVFKATMIGLPA